MSFTSLPEIPTGGLIDWQAVLFSAIKENIELLTGTRGESGLVSRAIIRGDITAAQMDTQKMLQVSAKGEGVLISGSNVPTLEDYVKLILDVQSLATDVAETRAAVNTLIANMKG